MTQAVTAQKTGQRIDIWHNILWSKYKGEVFSSLYKLADKSEFDIRFFQIAETEGNRVGLSGIDMERHRYPFTLLFQGSYEKSGFFKRIKNILRHTIKSDAELVVMTGYEKPEGWVQLFYLLLRGRKTAVFCDSTIYDQKQRPVRGLLKRIFFKSVDGIFGYGERSRDYVIHYGASPDKVYHRCQAAALPLNYTPEHALATRIATAPVTEAPRFLYVGRLSPEKGLDTLIDAFSRLLISHPTATLVLVGDGPIRKTLEMQARTRRLSASVQFVGSKNGDALFQEYAGATAFVLPSTSEPWGLVVNEALSYGCPVIVSNACGCVPELVIEGKTGYVHKIGDVGDLAEKMQKSITQFNDVTATAKTCIDLMSHYTPDKAAEQILAGCRAILRGSNK